MRPKRPIPIPPQPSRFLEQICQSPPQPPADKTSQKKKIAKTWACQFHVNLRCLPTAKEGAYLPVPATVSAKHTAPGTARKSLESSIGGFHHNRIGCVGPRFGIAISVRSIGRPI